MNLDSNDFELFGLETRFEQDPASVDARWKALQAQVHPDRFVAQGAASQRLAMQWSVRVNEAHRRLKDPLKRAAYLCELRGQPVQADSNTQMPPEFLMQQMAWREALDEVQGPEALAQLSQDVQASREQAFVSLACCLDDSPDAAQAVQWVRRLMFIDRFLQDLRRRGADENLAARPGGRMN
jgi:molecular chaperone HscB